MPRLTIIIPVYNKKKYLSQLFHDVNNQTFEDYECLLVDDGSTDGSGALCDEYALVNRRVRVFHLLNRGVSHARNVGLDHAKGDYITFVDSDDEFHPDYLLNLIRCMEQSKTDMVIGSFSRIWDDRDDRIPAGFPVQPGIYERKELQSSFAAIQKKYGSFGWCWGKLLKRELLEGIRFDESLKLAEDFDFYLKLYPKIRSIYFDDKPYYFYRQDAMNGSAATDDAQIDYLAQLRINLRYRAALQQMDAWNGENVKIVNHLLRSYAYFTLFHCPIACYEERFAELYDICAEEHIELRGGMGRQKVLLTMLRSDHMKLSKGFIRVYRWIRKQVRRHG